MSIPINPLATEGASSQLDRFRLESLQRQHRRIESNPDLDDRDAQIWEVAEGFEKIFLNILMKAMRGSGEGGEGFLGETYQTRMYRDMYHSELTSVMARRHDGLGIARMVHDFLAGEATPIHRPSATRSRILSAMPVEGRISSPFGLRRHPITGETQFHAGVDIAAATGAPIRSVGDGTVVFSGAQRGYGNTVIVEHRDGTRSVYAHNQENLVAEGDSVQAGQTIGLVGSTGRSTGPHLHFEIRREGENINPFRYWEERR